MVRKIDLMFEMKILQSLQSTRVKYDHRKFMIRGVIKLKTSIWLNFLGAAGIFTK
jgi:hypothetical protein